MCKDTFWGYFNLRVKIYLRVANFIEYLFDENMTVVVNYNFSQLSFTCMVGFETKFFNKRVQSKIVLHQKTLNNNIIFNFVTSIELVFYTDKYKKW